jgi:secreted Zn-dependent insulinase-like peptidase
MDQAAEELINNLHNIFEKITNRDFVLAKKKTLDSITSSRLDLQRQAERHFRKILDNNYNFQNYFKMEKFSKSITIEDFIKYYEEMFVDDNTLKMTVWVIYILT